MDGALSQSAEKKAAVRNTFWSGEFNRAANCIDFGEGEFFQCVISDE